MFSTIQYAPVHRTKKALMAPRRGRVPLRVRVLVPGQPLSTRRLRDSERACTSCGEMETSASQHPSIETENRLHPKKCLGYLACRKCQPPLKRDGSIEPGSVLRRVRLSQANQSSAQIPTVDKQQLDREGDQPQKEQNFSNSRSG